MPSDKHEDNNTYTFTFTLAELLSIEGWADAAVDAGDGLDRLEQELYDRISGARIELEVHAGTESKA